ncbi:MAG: class I SAM-dependent methyltransferase [Caulobacterales bacterium]|jgi:hypothetical protein
MSWSAGYVTDVDYTAGYITEMNPWRARLALIQAGYQPPEVATACELGFGRGVSLAIHAAASETQWWGTDINPSHASSAHEMLTAAGTATNIADQSFAEFCARDDLPEFDFIGLHGIWTWVDGDNRAIIADFLRRKLRLGGVAYISYNTMPGWTAMAPIRHIMAQHAQRMSAPGAGRYANLDAALEFAQNLLAVDPGVARSLPTAKERFEAVRKMDKTYLIHEYLNATWQPLYFSEVAETLQDAKLTYAGSTNTIEAVDPMNLTAAHMELLSKIKDPLFAQTVRDVLTNQQFRRDLWVKGARRMDQNERRHALLSERFMLTKPRDQIKLAAPGALGEVRLREEAFGPVPDVLARGEALNGYEILEAARPARVDWRHAIEALLVLSSVGDVAAVQPQATQIQAAQRTAKLNAHFLRQAESGVSPGFMASPVTGGATPVNRIQAMLLGARARGATEPAAQAAAVQQILAARGERMSQNGQAVSEPSTERDILTTMATELSARTPFLDRMQVMPQATASPPNTAQDKAQAAA